MSMLEWAENEIKLACANERKTNGIPEDEWDYGCACYESALKAFKSLCKDNHSGMSIVFTNNILNRLIDGKPITPIDDVPENWSEMYVCGREDYKHYQCTRMSSLFKDVFSDGTVKYRDVDNYFCINQNGNTYHSGLVQDFIDETYPITMPYMPPTQKMKVYCEEWLTDRKNGDFDTVGIIKVVLPNGNINYPNKYYAETENGWEEITPEKYAVRTVMDKIRKEEEANAN